MSRSRSLLAVGLLIFASAGIARAEGARSSEQPGMALSNEAAILRALKARDAAQGRSGLMSADSNFASIYQSGLAQSSTINQRGRGNTATTDVQAGGGNRTAQTQIGNRNVSAISIQNGSNNQIETAQQGNDNKIGLDFKDGDNTSVLYFQTGSGINAAGQDIVIQRNTSNPLQIVISQTSQ